jgi:hypothetical protein
MIQRSGSEIEKLRLDAQKAAFAAEDAGDTDDFAEGIYQTIQWLFGDGDRPDLGV